MIGNSLVKELENRTNLRELCFNKFSEYTSSISMVPLQLEEYRKFSTIKFALKQDFVVDRDTKFVVFSVVEKLSNTSIVLGVLPDKLGANFELISYQAICYGVYANSAFIVKQNTNRSSFQDAINAGYEVFYGQTGVNLRLLKVVVPNLEPDDGVVTTTSAYCRSYIIDPVELKDNQRVYNLVIYYCGVYQSNRISMASSLVRAGDMLQHIPNLDLIFSSIANNDMISFIFTKNGEIGKVRSTQRLPENNTPVESQVQEEVTDFVPSICNVTDPEEYIRETLEHFDENTISRLDILAANWSTNQQIPPSDINEYIDVINKLFEQYTQVSGMNYPDVPLNFNLAEMLKSEIEVIGKNPNNYKQFITAMLADPLVARATKNSLNRDITAAGVAYAHNLVRPVPTSNTNFHIDPNGPSMNMSLFNQRRSAKSQVGTMRPVNYRNSK